MSTCQISIESTQEERPVLLAEEAGAQAPVIEVIPPPIVVEAAASTQIIHEITTPQAEAQMLEAVVEVEEMRVIAVDSQVILPMHVLTNADTILRNTHFNKLQHTRLSSRNIT